MPYVLLAFFSSRIVVAVAGYLGIDLLTSIEPGRGKDLLTEAALMWDGAWYWRVAAQGYFAWNPETGSNLAFCPLYPGLTRAGMGLFDQLGLRFGDPTFGNFVISGLLISNLAFLAALYLLWWLVRLDHSPRVAGTVLLLIALFPAGLFWSAIYTESLFMLLLVGSFLCARKGIWWAAALLAGLAAVTRWAGILLAPVLLLEYISQKRGWWRAEGTEAGSREPGIGSRESGAGNREPRGQWAEAEGRGALSVAEGRRSSEVRRTSPPTPLLSGEGSQVLATADALQGTKKPPLLDGEGVGGEVSRSATTQHSALRVPSGRQHSSLVTRHSSVLWLGLAGLPLLLYMGWLGLHFGDPFVVLEVEHQGWQHSSSFFPMVYMESVQMLWQSWTGTAPVQPDPVMHWGNGQWLYMMQDLVFTAIFAGLAVLAFFKRWLRPSYLAFLVLGIVFPLSTGTTLAITRYLMPLFPAFVVLAMLMENRIWLRVIWLATSTALLAVTTFYWASGRWMG